MTCTRSKACTAAAMVFVALLEARAAGCESVKSLEQTVNDMMHVATSIVEGLSAGQECGMYIPYAPRKPRRPTLVGRPQVLDMVQAEMSACATLTAQRVRPSPPPSSSSFSNIFTIFFENICHNFHISATYRNVPLEILTHP